MELFEKPVLCQHCTTLTYEYVSKVRHYGCITVTHYFCNEAEALAYYMHHLREGL